ncbi:MAG: hypothetical protein Ct9H90mP9_3700 [Pseudomonadota bacterium]|nr:MAG: hypothetical protein Ct9H90mP9_3700 [Pseudomonadota bacterium]
MELGNRFKILLAFEVGFSPGQFHIFQEKGNSSSVRAWGAIYQGFCRVRMKIDKHHIGPGDPKPRAVAWNISGIPSGKKCPGSHRMGRIDADRHSPSSVFITGTWAKTTMFPGAEC